MVTVCTKEKRQLLGEVIYPQEQVGADALVRPQNEAGRNYTSEGQVGADALVRPQNKFFVRPAVRLSEIGQIVKHYINNVNTVYNGVTVDKFVIMPNHFHIIFAFNRSDDGRTRASAPTDNRSDDGRTRASAPTDNRNGDGRTRNVPTDNRSDDGRTRSATTDEKQSVSTERAVCLNGVVESIKSLSSRAAKCELWQRSFYDTVLRSEEMYRTKWNYIDTNPERWIEDEYFID